MDSSLLDSGLTPEKKLQMLKLSSTLDRDLYSEPGDYAEGRSFERHGARTSEGARSTMRTTTRTRNASTSSRRASSLLSTHRNKMSMDLTAQAETKFFALMESMSKATSEASSLKEYWSRLMADREAVAREKEELSARIEEVTESIEQNQNQHHHHGRELGERKKEVERLLLELSVALSKESEHKKRISERDHEVENVRQELHELRMTVSRVQIDYDRVKSDYDNGELKLRAAEGERDSARQDVDRYRSEHRTLTREYTEHKSRHSEITSALDLARKEVSVLMDRIRSWEREREEYLHEKDRLQEELRKANLRADDTAHELSSMTDRFNHLQREILKTKETIHFIESERDEHASTIDRLRHDIKSKVASVDDAESRYADVVLKFERTKRELTSFEDKHRELESLNIDLKNSLEKVHEEHRLVIIERDQHKDGFDDERRKIADAHRQNAVLRESLNRTETTLGEVRAEVTKTLERIRAIERERDDAKDKHSHFQSELNEHKEMVVLLQGQVKSLNHDKDRVHSELDDFRQKYDEVTEEITEYNNGSSEIEFEIESLRTMLSEAREQKERAISARASADRERDEYMSKYEEKCREMERYEETMRQSLSASANGGRSSSVRITKTSHSGGHSHGHGLTHGHESADGDGEEL